MLKVLKYLVSWNFIVTFVVGKIIRKQKTTNATLTFVADLKRLFPLKWFVVPTNQTSYQLPIIPYKFVFKYRITRLKTLIAFYFVYYKYIEKIQ